MTEIEAIQQEQTLADGNALAKKYAKMVEGDHRAFRLHLQGQTDERYARLAIPSADLVQIQEVESIRNEVHLRFQNLVRSVARRFARAYHMDSDDLEGQGHLFLIDAIYSYDRLDSKFITYATWVLMRNLKRYIITQRSFGKPNPSYLNLYRKFLSVRKALVVEGKPADFDSVVKTMRCKKNEIQSLRGVMAECTSLQEVEPALDKNLAWVDDFDYLTHLFNSGKLSDEEKSVLQYMMQGKSEREIAEQMEMGQKEVHQVFKSASKKLRQYAEAA